MFCNVFGFTVRPPPLDLRGLSTISECPFHVPLTRTMTEPRWDLHNIDLWQTHIYRSKWAKIDPLQICSSHPVLSVILFTISICLISSTKKLFVLTLLFLISPDLYFLPLQTPLHKCFLIYIFVMFMIDTMMFMLLVIRKILFYISMAVFGRWCILISVCLFCL